jgi:hypothetical protein
MPGGDIIGDAKLPENCSGRSSDAAARSSEPIGKPAPTPLIVLNVNRKAIR